ncbi:MAG TPA: type II secretion system protein GspG [Polyangiaceae bacterium]|nr:type II secretion system protein GspG [Polyangiaceae bacterium]
MPKDSNSDRRILFPWERRRMLRRWLGLGQLRPFLLLGALGAFVFLIALSERRAAGERQTRATLVGARRVVESYMADNDGGCPRDMTQAAEHARLEHAPEDAWGRPLRLLCPGHESNPYELMSDGPDGQPGGLDRIE